MARLDPISKLCPFWVMKGRSSKARSESIHKKLEIRKGNQKENIAIRKWEKLLKMFFLGIMVWISSFSQQTKSKSMKQGNKQLSNQGACSWLLYDAID
jgi:hypothetical protein